MAYVYSETMSTARIYEVKSQLPYSPEDDDPNWDALAGALRAGLVAGVESALTGYMKRSLRKSTDYAIGEGKARFVMRYTRLLDSVEGVAIMAAVTFLNELIFEFVRACPGRVMVQPLEVSVAEVGEGEFSLSTHVRMG